MKRILTALVVTLISFSGFAATEISKAEAVEKNLVKVESVSKSDRTAGTAIKEVSKAADNKNAQYFVITAVEPEGNGSSVLVMGDLYK